MRKLCWLLVLSSIVVAQEKATVPFFGNLKCPITGKDIDKAYYTEIEGQKVWTCCKQCKAKVKENPADALKAAYPADQVSILKLADCPIMNKPAKEEHTIVWQGHQIPFCCKKCVGMFKKEPNKRLAMIKEPKLVDLKNTMCPVMPEETVIPDLFVVYKNQIINLCCDSCPEEVIADPEKTMKALANLPKPGEPKKDAAPKKDG